MGAIVVLAFLVAILYASVGHGGASGYLAVMSLAGMTPAEMKPTALMLNLLVAGSGSIRYIRAGCFRWSTFWPFALGSIPFAFLGGATTTADDAYRKALGALLFLAAVVLALPRKQEGDGSNRPILVAVLAGALIGYVSGMIGVGGGIFLSPLLILTGWATTRQTLGISSLFILLNSAAGLAGHVGSLQQIPPYGLWLAIAAFAGGLIGSELGARRLTPRWVRLILAVVLVIAALKLFFT